jgi:hypothetical protein
LIGNFGDRERGLGQELGDVLDPAVADFSEDRAGEAGAEALFE